MAASHFCGRNSELDANTPPPIAEMFCSASRRSRLDIERASTPQLEYIASEAMIIITFFIFSVIVERDLIGEINTIGSTPVARDLHTESFLRALLPLPSPFFKLNTELRCDTCSRCYLSLSRALLFQLRWLLLADAMVLERE